MKNISAIFLSAVLLSCNPIGETIKKETPVDTELVNTSENIDLKNGDVLVIWAKMDASFIENNHIPPFDLNYNLSKDGKTTENGTVPMFYSDSKIINSTHENRKDEEEEEEEEIESSETDDAENAEKQEKPVRSDWNFEQEIIKIPIKQDGKYTLDYKATSNDEDAKSMFTKLAIILRKK